MELVELYTQKYSPSLPLNIVVIETTFKQLNRLIQYDFSILPQQRNFLCHKY